jgi:hypothetical protein
VRHRILVILALALFLPARANAQAGGGGGYLSVTPAVSAGDGGAAPAVSASAGYVTPHRIGFEVEFTYADRLKLGDQGGITIQYAGAADPAGIAAGLPQTEIFPPVNFRVSGRLLSIQTNAVGELVSTRRFRASVAAGGGVATLRQRSRTRVLPLGGATPQTGFPVYEQTISITDTGLSLDAGLTMEYRLGRRVGVGGDVQYQHVFVNPSALDLARVGGRFIWRF